MKSALILLVTGLFLGLAVPYLWGDHFSGAGVQLPQFIWSTSPPRTFQFSLTTFFRIVGIVIVALAVLCFILFRGSDAK